MSFVTDLTDLPFPKADLNPVPVGADPTKFQSAAEWNTVCQAVVDLRTFVLAAQNNKNLVAFWGNSNFNSAGATTDGSSRQDDVLSANPKVLLDKIYGTAAGEPVNLVDMGRGFLRAANVSTFPGFGPEVSFGKEYYDLFNGFGTPVNSVNMPWLVCVSISGVRIKDGLPASTYGHATPAFGGRNFYEFFRDRVRAAEDASGRQLGLIISDLGPNDGADETDASNVAANWVTTATQLAIDFPGVQFLLMQMNVNCDAAFRPTVVRPQLALAASEIPGCRLIVQDDLALNSDNIHYGARRIYTAGGRQAAFAAAALGLAQRTTSIPAFLGYGQPEFHPVSGSTTTLKPCSYPLARDKVTQLLLVGSMKNSGGYTTIPSPTVPVSGWASLGNTTQAFGGQTQGVALFMRNLSQADIDTNNSIPPGATILLSNDENYAKLFALFGSGALALDGTVTTFKETSFTNTPFAAAGVTTAVANSLVVVAFVTQGGGVSPTEHFTVSNSNLTNLTIVTDEPYALNTGNFGVLVVVVGTMVTPGATGNTTLTKSASFNAAPCGFTAAFKVAT